MITYLYKNVDQSVIIQLHCFIFCLPTKLSFTMFTGEWLITGGQYLKQLQTRILIKLHLFLKLLFLLQCSVSMFQTPVIPCQQHIFSLFNLFFFFSLHSHHTATAVLFLSSHQNEFFSEFLNVFSFASFSQCTQYQVLHSPKKLSVPYIK